MERRIRKDKGREKTGIERFIEKWAVHIAVPLMGTLIAIGSYGLGGINERYKIEREKPEQPQLNYQDLVGFGNSNDVIKKDIKTVMYDFGGESLFVLSDLTRDGEIDHMTVQSCVPYRGHELSHIYISKELAPTSKQDENFTVVDPSFFYTFNRLDEN